MLEERIKELEAQVKSLDSQLRPRVFVYPYSTYSTTCGGCINWANIAAPGKDHQEDEGDGEKHHARSQKRRDRMIRKFLYTLGRSRRV